MNKSYPFLVVFFFVLCSNPTSNDNQESIITCLNGISYSIRYSHYPQGKSPAYFTNDITTNQWITLDLQFNLNDSLKSISVSPGKHDTLCFDTLWAEDTDHITKTYTFENVISNGITFDTTYQLGFGTNTNIGSKIQWEKLDTKTLAYCPVTTVSDTTYSAEIMFIHPIISTGHIKIKLKAIR
jgi:hypothetical protein